MTEFCTGKRSDREDIIDFINMVFSQTGQPHDFKALLPKLYADDTDTSADHFLAKENGKIKAVVGLFPTYTTVGGIRLKLGHIGSVSVHKYARGKGYMKQLMTMAIDAAAKGGYDALVLGGMKNRYQYFGFQPTGAAAKYSFIPENFSHQYKGGHDAISFERMEDEHSKYISEIRALYKKRPVWTDRGDDRQFFKVLCSWNGTPYAVIKNGNFAGYMTDLDGQFVGEWGFKEIEDFPAVLAAWFSRRQLSSLTVCAPPYDAAACEVLGKYCESFSPMMRHSWHILNFCKIIEAFMCVKNSSECLEDGSFMLGVKKYDGDTELCKLFVRNGNIQVQAGNISAEKSNAGKAADRAGVNTAAEGFDANDCEKAAAIGLLEAEEALFSEAVRYRNYGLDGGLRYKNWFPLPLYIDENDAC